MKIRTKKLWTTTSVLVILMTGLTFYIIYLKNTDKPPANPEVTIKPIFPSEDQSTQSSNKVKTSINNTNNVQQNIPKYSSSILSSYPKIVENRYYLLGSVNDPSFGSSWSLNKVQASRAWDLTTGDQSITIAVIDSGFALNHEELVSRWKNNTSEMGDTQSGDHCWTGISLSKQTNDCDDDQNGYIDDWRGYDFYNNDNNPMSGETNPSGDATQHGTSVAGVLASTANNLKGSAGIDQQAKIMPLQIFSDDGEATSSSLIAAIEYATDNGAKIINLSLGTDSFDQPLLDVIRYAKNNGTTVFAASGNCALNDDSYCNNLPGPGRMTYPALFSETISVGSSSSNDTRSNFSSHGPELDIVAPGSLISPLPTFTSGNQISAYATASGTSFASPLVAGTASLLLSQNPNLSPDEIHTILTMSADKLNSMAHNIRTDEYGYGRLNAHKATLLTSAKNETNLLGTRSLSPREPAIGNIWRSSSASIGNNEYILIGCRVFISDTCSATIENGTIFRFSQQQYGKNGELQYIFVRGDGAPSGTWNINIHNRNFATHLTNLTK